MLPLTHNFHQNQDPESPQRNSLAGFLVIFLVLIGPVGWVFLAIIAFNRFMERR